MKLSSYNLISSDINRRLFPVQCVLGSLDQYKQYSDSPVTSFSKFCPSVNGVTLDFEYLLGLSLPGRKTIFLLSLSACTKGWAKKGERKSKG